MLRLAKRILCLAMLGLSVPCASAYSLLGPFEPYQVAVITYQVGGDLGGPHNLGEEFRRNTPVMYYTIDANFLDYFGTDGSNAIVQAFEIMNSVFTFTNVDGRVITNVSDFQPDLSEFPMEAQSYNYMAQALQLLDLKSATLILIVEQMGLAEPDRYTWTLHDRLTTAIPCPVGNFYTVIKRNFDPAFSSTDQLQPTSYVNGRLYSYFLQEFCTGTPFLADAVEYPVDQLASVFTAVASGFSIDFFRLGLGLDFGGYYNGLTRDDVGGLRYLLRTNNMNIEAAGADTFAFFTNNNTFQLLFTSNLTLFASQALTNDAATLNALYPNLIITSTTLIFTNVVTTNQIAFFQNSPYAPVGSPATLVTNTTFTTNVAIWFRHTFANVVTNSVFTSGAITILTTNVTFPVNAPFGSPPVTNVTLQNIDVPMIMGDFFIIPTNLCSFSIVSTQLVYVLSETNLIVVATNTPTTTNISGQEFSQSIITYSTNSVFVVNPVVCPSNSVALRQGIGQMKFVRRDFDSLLNRFFYPITNVYTVYAVTNNTLIPQRVERFVTQPDFLITAEDLATTPADGLLGAAFVARSLTFETNNIYPALFGPGTLTPGQEFSFNKVGPIYQNQFTGFFIGPGGVFISAETNQIQLLVWGSFDGTTNAPVVYPNGTSITNLENSVLIRVFPSTPVTNGAVQLPNGTVGVDYATVFGGFTATGGQPPYSWAMAPGSALPPNLVLNADGTITGAPHVSTAGFTFDFVIRMTDAGSRFVDRPYAITINP